MLGGAAGTAARYGLGQRFPVDEHALPAVTLVENVLGAALLGLLLTVLVVRDLPLWLRPLLATGALGSFTTFSTFATEVVLLVDGGHATTAALYVAATMALGIAAAAGGIGLAQRLAPAPDRRRP